MADAVAALQRATQSLGQAYDAYHGSQFMKYFAAKQLPELSDDQKKMRLQILRLAGTLVDTEFDAAMDRLVLAWKEYKETE